MDVHVGSRVRLGRVTSGISQEKLATKVGVTFQQVQKYEKGRNRISASRLYDIAHVLEVPISFFFDGMPGQSEALSGRMAKSPTRCHPLIVEPRGPHNRASPVLTSAENSCVKDCSFGFYGGHASVDRVEGRYGSLLD